MMNVIRINTIDSTNRLMRELSLNSLSNALEEGTILVADTQTAGRGQAGSSWEANPGKNLTCSLILYPLFLPLERHFLLSAAIALGIKDSLDVVTGGLLPFSIKWPNDIYCEHRKIAGILIENDLMHRQITRSIVGIGLNINQETFTGNIPNPISLKQLLGVSIPPNDLLEELHSQIMLRYRQLQEGQFELIATDYHAALYRKSGFHPYRDNNGLFNAHIQSVGDDGILHLKTDTGHICHYAFKEVRFVI